MDAGMILGEGSVTFTESVTEHISNALDSSDIREKTSFDFSLDSNCDNVKGIDEDIFNESVSTEHISNALDSSDIREKTSFDFSLENSCENVKGRVEDIFNDSNSSFIREKTSFEVSIDSSRENIPHDIDFSLNDSTYSESEQLKPSTSKFGDIPLSPIAKDLDFAIYEFEDSNTPPPVRAPSIGSEGLFEDTLKEDSSDVISIVSSALETSGSSTESLPFGHLEYEEPILTTSTPLKKRRKDKSNVDCRESNLLKKKLSSSAIKKVFEDCGCKRPCINKDYFDKVLLKRLRLSFWGLNKQEKTKWMLEKFADFQSASPKLLVFKVSGKNVCRKAWLNIYGIPKSSFYRYKAKWLTNRLGSENTCTLRSLKERKQAAITWLGEYIAKRGEHPPHKTEVWLPFGLRKKEIYEAYRNEQIVDMRPFVSNMSFYKMWKSFYRHVRMRPTNLFTKCTVCVKLDRALQSQLNPTKRQEIFREKQEHLHRVMVEKLAYYRRREISRRRPDRFVSLIIDGMDQSKTSLPHFKDRKGKDLASTLPLKTHISAVISHGTNQRMVFSDIYQYKHDSNLTLNILMKVLWELSKGKPLPPVLYIQADNCFRENKNRYILSFLELLVHLKIFYEVQLSFLQVGHTHEDIDQMFSVFSDKLNHTDALTLDDFHKLLYNAQSLESCFDISGWLEPYLAGVKYHTKSNIFRFRLLEPTAKVNVFYRRSTRHPWKTLKNGFFKISNGRSVLPQRSPEVLLLSLDKVDIQALKRGFAIWKNYFNEGQKQWWSEFLRDLEKLDRSKALLTQKSKRGCQWKMPMFKHYDKAALEQEDVSDPIPDDLRGMINAEQTNEEIFVNN